MTPEQLRKKIAALDLSQVSAAIIFGINARTMRRYCSGEAEIPQWMPLALVGISVEKP